jgi:hypothetical protein
MNLATVFIWKQYLIWCGSGTRALLLEIHGNSHSNWHVMWILTEEICLEISFALGL